MGHYRRTFAVCCMLLSLYVLISVPAIVSLASFLSYPSIVKWEWTSTAVVLHSWDLRESLSGLLVHTLWRPLLQKREQKPPGRQQSHISWYEVEMLTFDKNMTPPPPHCKHNTQVHAVALWAVSTREMDRRSTVRWDSVASFWLCGTILFSGSLYGLSLGGPRLLGPVTPIGGTLMLVGWGLLFAGNEGGSKTALN